MQSCMRTYLCVHACIMYICIRMQIIYVHTQAHVPFFLSVILTFVDSSKLVIKLPMSSSVF